MVTNDLTFRQVITLRDGTRVLLRPLITEDKQALIELFVPVPYEERQHMRHDINDPELVASWADNIEYDRIFPIVAVVGNRIVGNGTLHFGQGPSRHRAEVRVFLARDFRRRGLGLKLSQAMIELARRRNLYLLEVQTVRDLSNDIKAMEKVGFETKCILEDYYMLPDGELRDVVIMLMRLRTPEGEF